MISNRFSWDEVNTLISILREQGVSYLWGNEEPQPTKAQTYAPMEPVELIQRLVLCSYPLVENASISLFLLHPEFVPAIFEACKQSSDEAAERIAVLTLATLYLQRWWWFRLAFALGRLPDFPEQPFTDLWEERYLPTPSEGYGLTGLLALQEYQQQKYNAPFNFLHDWQNQIDHLLSQEDAHHRTLQTNLVETLRKQSLQEQPL